MNKILVLVSLCVFFATSMFSSQSAFAGGVCLFDSNCSNNGQNLDGNPCTGVVQCVLGVCAQPPSSGASCNDGVQCTTSDTCVVGVCVGVPNTGNLCGDQTSTQCNGPDTCIAGTCTNPNLKTGNSCNDGFECTTSDTCAVGLCVGVPNTGMNCGSGPSSNGCSNQDFCVAGFCTPNHVLPGVSCDNGDGQACTGSCSGGGTCLTSPGTGASCDDANECTIADSCVAGACLGSINQPGTSCDNGDGQECTGACNVIGSCITAPATSGNCDNGNECTILDSCNAGVCETGFGLTGDDCGAGGTECSAQDTCDSGTCVPNDLTAGTACGDSSDGECINPDSCDGIGSCQSNDEPDNTSCDDGELCTIDEFCKDGECGMGTETPILACMDDESEPGSDVGGALIPINTTPLLLAGAQMTTSWLIPVLVAGAGIVLVIVSRKSN